MNLYITAVLGLYGVSLASPAAAMDCTKATTETDKLICASPELKQADTMMSAVYFKLLRETADPEFHEALIRSQRRWLQAREGKLDTWGLDIEVDDRSVLLDLTNDRLSMLREKVLIANLQAQRAVMAKVSGGPFTGVKLTCQIVPPPLAQGRRWEYECWTSEQRQNGDRICTLNATWASSHFTDYRLVSVLKDGKPVPVASCKIGYSDTDDQAICPEPKSESKTAHWNTNPKLTAEFLKPTATGFSKYDADFANDGSYAGDKWMSDCSAPEFPPPKLSRP